MSRKPCRQKARSRAAPGIKQSLAIIIAMDRKAMVESDDWEGPAYEHCRNVASVCGKFEMSRRHDNLTFTHHAECASLPPDEADKVLDWAEANSASVMRHSG